MGRPRKDERAQDLKRVQCDLAPKSFNRLVSLQERTDSASYGETIRKALWIYETLLDSTDDSVKVTVVSADTGDTTVINLIGIAA